MDESNHVLLVSNVESWIWTKKNMPHEQTLGFNRTQKWWIWSINGWMDRQQRRIHIFSRTFLLGSRGLRLLSTWCLEFGWSNDPGAKPGAKFGARLENGRDFFDDFRVLWQHRNGFFIVLTDSDFFPPRLHSSGFFLHPCWGCPSGPSFRPASEEFSGLSMEMMP